MSNEHNESLKQLQTEIVDICEFGQNLRNIIISKSQEEMEKIKEETTLSLNTIDDRQVMKAKILEKIHYATLTGDLSAIKKLTKELRQINSED